MLALKEKVFKIVYKISLLPYVGILIFGIYSAFFGISLGFFGEQTLIYGWDSFWAVVVFSTMVLIENAIIPICLIYQLFYLMHYLIKKNKSKKEVE